MSAWFQRQFGDRAELAISFSLGGEAHNTGVPERDASWGTLEIWARDRCLTASVSDGDVSQSIRWCMLPVLEWMLDVGIRLVNEDPYPGFSKDRHVRDGAQWYDATLSPPALEPLEEEQWFLQRSAWRHHHALRRAAEDVALPNVVFKRLGDDVEVSWDNDAWAPPRRGMYFVEKRGVELVRASAFAKVVRETLVAVTAALAQRTELPRFSGLAERAGQLEAGERDWRWLIHRPTAELIRSSMPQLRASLDAAAAAGLDGLYVPHTVETAVLRQFRAESVNEVDAVLAAVGRLPKAPISKVLQGLIAPRPARNQRSWEEGNEFADRVRDELDWGIEPLPDLTVWLPDHGIAVSTGDLGLSPSIAVLAERATGPRAMAHVNPRSRSEQKRETGLATALGHVLMDANPIAIDGEWEHWPTAARARAFGVALLLPEDGVRELVPTNAPIRASDVREIMRHYRAGPFATTYRLKNLNLISSEEHDTLMRQLAA
ncbi:MAG TPA: hypothetical protein VGM88_28120 [Kofleriaceae bacterium]|jgi:Zn-dependent peptidase ImmA (M78 family)